MNKHKKYKKIIAACLSIGIICSMSSFIGFYNNNKITIKAAEKADWLTTKGNKIVDMDGNEVWLTGVNWFGFNTQRRTFDGLWSSNLRDNLKLIADHGMNLLRIPMAAEQLLDWKAGKPYKLTWEFNKWKNSEFVGNFDPDSENPNENAAIMPTDLDTFNIALQLCKEMGIKVMVDIHSDEVDDNGHQRAVWWTDKISTAQYYEALEWLADTYKNDDTIIAIDLKNEPHGKKTDAVMAKWDDSTDENNWQNVASVAGKKVLAKNPNLLIMVEGVEVYPKEGFDYTATAGGYGQPENYYGTWWGGNFRGAKEYPVDLGDKQDQLVYSPHDYGPSVWAQSWFEKDFTTETLYEDCWGPNWMYLMEDGDKNGNTYPLLIGEWGGFVIGDSDERAESQKDIVKNTKWLSLLQEYIIENKIHHTFWCFNYNSSDTGGLMWDDFQQWNEPKYQFLKPALWTAEDTNKYAGKFVGLDHDIPLGANGITLSQYYENSGGPSVTTTPALTSTTTSVTATVSSSSSTVSNTSSSQNPDSKIGDIDLDNQVGKIADVVLLGKHVASKITLTGQSLINANCDTRDAAINVADLQALIKFMLKQVSVLPFTG
ncbi:endoglucanase [Clostridia bacterium]|nr:endoglucanase [Clostridia bacterium]